jgi:hypothetical protein
VVAVGDETCGHLLVVGGYVPDHQAPQRAQFADQDRGCDDIAQAQAMSERLRQAAEVNHAALRVQALERWHRLAGKVELALVVVFDDDEVVARSTGKQLLPPRQRHGDGGRALVAWRRVHHPTPRQAGTENEPLRVHAQRPHVLRAQREVVARVGVARVLDAHGRRSIDQQRSEQEDRLLRTTGDQDLVTLGPDAARRQQAAMDLLDK